MQIQPGNTCLVALSMLLGGRFQRAVKKRPSWVAVGMRDKLDGEKFGGMEILCNFVATQEGCP